MNTVNYRILILLACLPFPSYAAVPYPFQGGLAAPCGDRHDTKEVAGECVQYAGQTNLDPAYTGVSAAVQTAPLSEPAAAYPAAQGKILFSSSRDGNYEIYTMNADGTQVTRLTSNGVHDFDARFSPDGTSIGFVRNNQVWMMNSDGTSQRYLVDGKSFSFAPDGKAIFYSDGADIYRYDFATAQTTQLVDGNIYSGGNSFPELSPAGDLIYINTFVYSFPHVQNVFKLANNSAAAVNLTKFDEFSVGYANSPRWSADGTRIVFHYSSNNNNFQLIVTSPDGSQSFCVTCGTNASNNAWGVWSPDGNYVAFRSGATLPQSIYIIRTDGTGLTKLTVDGSGVESYPTDWRLDTGNVVKADQTIVFGPVTAVLAGGTGTVSATGGASGNPVIFTSQTTAVCTTGGTNGTTVTGVTAGTCTIAANQAGNADYNAAVQATQSFAVSQFCMECLPSRGGWRAILH